MNVAPLGDVARGVHFWTANLVMATVLLHTARVFVTGAYKRPREANWLIGLGLLTITIGLIFTGTVLKWDQEGFEALAHNVEIGDLLGAFGVWFSPAFSTSLPIVGRLYIAHVVILPAIGTLLLIAHFLLVKRHGISARPVDFDAAVDGGPEPSKSGSTFAVHVIRMVGFGLVILAATSVLSLVVRTPLGPAPDPSIEASKPWWMFLPFYPFEDWFGLPALIWAPGLLATALALVPFVDRSRYRSPSRRRAFMITGAIVMIALAALVAYAIVSPAASHIGEM
jgi:ubiquinol-cytochrome c reductase cytochrome b subunit